MNTESYHGLRIDDEPDLRTQTIAVHDHWFNVYDDDGMAFRVRMRVHWSYAVALGTDDPIDASRHLAQEHGRLWVHGLIDLGRWSRGEVYEETRNEEWVRDAPGEPEDEFVRLELLGALQRMRRAERATDAIYELDVRGLASVLRVDFGRAKGVLGELLDEGLVEENVPHFGMGPEDGACRITGAGLRALKELRGSGEPARERQADEDIPPLTRPGVASVRSILFTDIVGSTSINSAIGDEAWRELLEEHNRIIRETLELHGGVESGNEGDGFCATFDLPTQAIACAAAIVGRVHKLDIEVRAGIHSGECTLIDGSYGGLAFAVASRIVDLAGNSEILVSMTVKTLAGGSTVLFEDRGVHDLQGVDGAWQVFAVMRQPAAN